jgi:hypothetical protein
VEYVKVNNPTIITIGRFARWGLTTLKKSFFGIGGTAFSPTICTISTLAF